MKNINETKQNWRIKTLQNQKSLSELWDNFSSNWTSEGEEKGVQKNVWGNNGYNFDENCKSTAPKSLADPKHKTHEENDMKTPISCSKYDKDKSLKEVRLCLNKDKNDKKVLLETI